LEEENRDDVLMGEILVDEFFIVCLLDDGILEVVR